MKLELNSEFWSSRYQNSQVGWDLGQVSPPIKKYFEQDFDKSMSILIPGCGNAYEAEYLFRLGFTNVFVIDLAQEPLDNLMSRCPEFPEEQAILADFFQIEGQFDLMIEQTLFCAIDPSLRPAYAKQASQLLKPSGKLIGLLFNRDFEGGPPFGGSAEEYKVYFEKFFQEIKMDSCYNSVEPRSGSEVFIQLLK